MTAPRILFVTPYYKPAYVYGGPTRSIATLCESLVDAGARVKVLTTNANGPSRLEVSLGVAQCVDGVDVTYYPLGSEIFLYSPDLAAAIADHLPTCDLAVLESLWLHSFGVAAGLSHRLGVPYVVATRGKLMPWALDRKALKKRLYYTFFAKRHLNRAAAFHCTIQEEAEAVHQLGLVPPTFVLPNSIDLAKFEQLPPRGAIRAQHAIADDEVLFLYLGRLHEVKRPDIAIHALAAARAQGMKASLLLAGPDRDGLAAVLATQAQAAGVEEFVHFAGLLTGDEVLQAFADADLLLMPSEVTENFGRSAAEALAAGVPIIVSQGIAIGAIAEQAGAGRQVDCSPEAFAAAVVDLLAEQTDLVAMGRRGRAVARREFDRDAVAQRMIAQYKSIIETGLPLQAE